MKFRNYMKNFLTNSDINNTWYISLLRILNYIFLIIYALALFCTPVLSEEFKITGYKLLVLFCFPPIGYIVLIYLIIDGIELQDWDYFEQKKKKNFTKNFTLQMSLASLVIIFFLYISVWHFCMLSSLNNDKLLFCLDLGYSIVFLSNAVFPFYLHNKIFI
ncbi:MAG: hypothetical protein BWZ11_00883 [Bacteroidetes bacterium ADurb.BinA395]|nr:MAG: hypothetical protein BWZ11_00883 [Bacteroidetes bacterium ADurb.BinA395]